MKSTLRILRHAAVVMGRLIGPAVLGVGLRAAEITIHPPIGPYVHLAPADLADVPSWSVTNRLVLTPYFYWYDVTTGAHIIDADRTDALTDHPPTLEGFSWRFPAWHEEQLRDMIDAGIDILLPVYWGAPSERLEGRPVSEQPWSYAGLPPLVEAREKLLREGLNPPRIGMFYDTSTLQYNREHRRIDLTTDFGKQWFYESVRDFFSLIPPRHWALIDGRPVVFLYSAAFASAHDQGCIDYLKAAFARDFGGREPYIVREVSWQVQADDVYAWGGALGLKNPGVGSLGPGYDHSAVPGRTPLVVDREGGAFFERNWTRFLRRPSHLVFIETWNEYHEGTDIAASREYGRQYIELNRRYADWFRAGHVPPMPRGPFSDARRVWVELGPTNQTHGLVQVESADGVTAPAEVGGRPCRAMQPTVHPGRYIYFRIDDSFKWADSMLVEVEVEYFDHAGGSFTIEYDGSDPNAPFSGAYTRAGKTVSLTGSGTWKTATFRLPGARFLNGQNAGTDFRLAIQAPAFHVARVEVRRLGVPAEAGETVPGRQASLESLAPPDWVVLPGEGPPPVVRKGILSLSGGDPPARLWFPTALFHGTGEELLARVRVRGLQGTETGAGALGVGGDEAKPWVARIEWVVGPERGWRLSAEAAGASVFQTRTWLPNTWYWMRLRYTWREVGGYPDVWVRLWRADGETIEPVTWDLTLDLAGLAPPPEGWLTLEAPPAGDAVLETDFLFVRAANESAVTVRLPPLPPAWLELDPPVPVPDGGLRLTLEGAPRSAYLIERTADFVQWEPAPLMTDLLGRAHWLDAAAPSRRWAFYRAREAN